MPPSSISEFVFPEPAWPGPTTSDSRLRTLLRLSTSVSVCQRKVNKKSMIRFAAGPLVLFGLSYALIAAAPPGWFLAGSAPQSYDTGVDPQVTYGGQSG